MQMPRVAREMRPAEIKRLVCRYDDKPTLYPVGGIAGLHMQVTPTGAKSWAVRLTVNGKRRWMGLGSYPEISMADARDRARQVKQMARDGIDPIEKRRAMRSATTHEMIAASFSQVVNEFIPIKQQELSPGKHRDDWGKQVRKYTFAKLGPRPIEEITKHDIGDALSVMRGRGLKNETVDKVRQALKEIFRYAIAKEYYKGNNPAEKPTLNYLIGKPPAESQGDNYPSLQVDDVGRFWAALQSREGISAEALRFQMMTATRSGAIRFATWDEFDLDAMVWTVQPGRRFSKIKSTDTAKRVALTQEMIAILKRLPRLSESDFVFWAPRGGGLSDATISAVMKKMHEADKKKSGTGFIDAKTGKAAVPHGLRSTFRVWAQERSEYDPNLAEVALWHSVGSKVERAYARSDMLEKRRKLMNSWVRFIDESARLYTINQNAKTHKALLNNGK